MRKITTCLWFDNNAEDAAKFYVSNLKNSSIGQAARYSKDGAASSGRPEGSLMTIVFHLDGLELMGLNGGPIFSFTPAISLFVNCSSEEEINTLYSKLSEDGAVLMELDKYPFSEKFAWVNDKFGLSWQLNLAARPQKISPALLFIGEQHGKAEEAMNFYTSQFQNSSIVKLERHGAAGPEPEGTVSHGIFSINGQEFIAINASGAHPFSFNPSISFVCHCETQEELDDLWNRLSAGGRTNKCGWLTDKYGVSWQIIPADLAEMIKDQVRGERVMKALLQMTKLDIETLKRAYQQS